MCLALFASYHCLKLVNKSQWKKLQSFNEKYYRFPIKYFFLQGYVFAYSKQVLLVFIMLVHSENAQEM